jgi:hypothetical protein
LTATTYSTASSDATGQLHFFAAGASTDSLLGPTVQPDDACVCGEQRAVLKTGKPPHAASLVCVSCGHFRGWLPNQAASFIENIINKHSRPTEAIAHRRGPSTPLGGNTEMQFDNTNRGSLFSNKDKKVKDTDPDFTRVSAQRMEKDGKENRTEFSELVGSTED